MAGPKLNKLKRVSLQQTSVLVFSGIAAIVFLSLLTYRRTDCGFFRHDSDCIITNKAGSVGAYLSEFLFSSFGFLSYMIPVGLLMVGIIMFRFPHKRNPHNPRGGINAVLSVAGMIATLIAGSGLSTLLFPVTDLTHSGGGLIGVIVARIFRMFFGDYGSTLILLSIFFAGMTLMADIPWGKIVELIGDKVIQLFDMLSGGDKPVEATAGASIPDDRQEKADANENTKQAGDLGIKDLGLKSVAYLSAAGAGVGALWKKAQGKSLSTPPSNVGANDTHDGEETDFLLASVDQPVPAAQTRAPVVGSVSLPDDLDSLPSATDTAIDSRVEAKPLITPPSLQQAKPESKLSQMLKKPPARALNKAVSLPPLSLLNPPPEGQGEYDPEYLDNIGRNIIEALGHYGVRGVTVEQWHPGPVVTRYELQLNAGTKVSKVSGLAKDLARNLGVHSVRVVEVIPGKTTIGIEVPNDKREMVTIGSVLESEEFNNSESSMTLALGKDISGIPVVADLGKMPHLLVAGTTGAGKSVAVNVMLVSMLYKSTAEEVRLILIDPKMLELSIYEDIPHLLTPVVTDMKDAANALRWCVAEMERRYLLMSKLKVRNLAGYNQKVKDAIDRGEPIMDPLFDPTKALDPTPKALEPMPHIVIVVDEFADMMMVVGKKVEELIARIAQKARAAGMHLILATQRPSVDVITGLIKANIPSRIAFNVSTRVDSRTILDQGGAEQLLGLGDMLYLPSGSSMPNRVHGAFVSDEEVEEIVRFVKTQGEPDYITSVIEQASGNSDAIPGLEPLSSTESETDPLYDEGIAIVTESRRASISYLQRRLKVGYNRAATMIEEMETAGVVSAVQSNGQREVLAPPPVTD